MLLTVAFTCCAPPETPQGNLNRHRCARMPARARTSNTPSPTSCASASVAVSSAAAFGRLWCMQHGCKTCAMRRTMKQASQEPPPRLKTATALGIPALAGLSASGLSPKMPSAAAMGSSSRRTTFPCVALRHLPGIAMSTCTCAEVQTSQGMSLHAVAGTPGGPPLWRPHAWPRAAQR